MSTKKIIPIFYASDENYMPYLGVALASLKANKSSNYDYKIHVLYTGKLNGHATKVKEMEEEGFAISFTDVATEIDRIRDCMICRDYYTPAIYYRLLIPELFPQYDKVLYMDCDTAALTDVADLYNIEIGENYIGAVADQAVAAVSEFCDYTKNALGIDGNHYFNSGVILMNLKKFREVNFCEKFVQVLRSYNFVIAPDQDVLNLICKDKVYYLDAGWNQMPIALQKAQDLKLIHYNLTMKPWRYDGILYEEYFWAFAEKTEFLDFIKETKANFTQEMANKERESSEKLLALARTEADNPNNFIRSIGMPF